MIIQCEQCETKFRFDESRVPPEGVWVRCSRCRHEFFQHHPQAQPPTEEEMLIPDIHIDEYKPIPEVLPGIEELAADKPADKAEKGGGEAETPGQKEATRTPLTVLYLLIALILLASLGIWVLPDVRMKAMKMLSPHVPAIESMLGAGQSKKKSGLEGIQIHLAFDGCHLVRCLQKVSFPDDPVGLERFSFIRGLGGFGSRRLQGRH